MLKIQKFSAVALLVGAVLATSACKDDKKAQAAAEPAKQEAPAAAQAENSRVKDPSYAVGVLIGNDLKGLVEAQKDVIAYDNDKILAGVAEALQGKIDLTNQDVVNTLKDIDEKLKVAAQTKAEEQAKQAKAESDKFIAEFKQKDGVKETKSGLLYRIEKEGEGAAIKPTDSVKVHYTSKLTNGTVFDSSVERGQPVEFLLDQVIPGWTEGLQLVKKGGKIELVIPAELAYGEQDLGTIPPNSTLHFEVEVLDVTPAKK
ncbi:FKBP-type peptidyl-prolyl cis-trans isomerase [Basfia succiniciproducens]|uniref:Peptidyl-prolyl cis-trans isomerase n=1 Tax=Basfia succiniciproducens TaxID=653940 RepID=A0A1G5CUL0_9PAST|nr:FKBP-type peptidyl-prolyl cis-trans isomerase [Basfia succiniciproducens]QIM69574.1 peptidylprolyl isomerase [Basfia succiniciproducens]SCY05938.1 FKBP-type peptidyl-prolyl cis-trans isomerase FkpA [Basfia succiniciproducens]